MADREEVHFNGILGLLDDRESSRFDYEIDDVSTTKRRRRRRGWGTWAEAAERWRLLGSDGSKKPDLRKM